MRGHVLALLTGACAALAARAEPPHLHAQTLQTWTAPEADQGVAVDAQSFYAVDNTVIARYPLDGRARDGLWQARPGTLRHLNSCLMLESLLWCAHSNYPQQPMTSSVEVFDPRAMAPLRSLSLGHRQEGSLVWFDRAGEDWIVGFAHYDGKGGEPGRSQRYSEVLRMDSAWRRVEGWRFPDALLTRMAPHAASGGALGPDGWLYVMGHDRPEMYVLGLPVMGSELVHLATLGLEAQGQAFAFVPESRSVMTIDRRQGRVRRIELPALPGGLAEARRFRPPD